MSESVEVRIARMEEQFKVVVRDAEEARNSRKEQYKMIEAINQNISSMVNDVAAVKTKLDGQAPTIEEFITIKHKVVGAGKMGKALWAFGAFLIGMVYSSREAVIAFFTR